MSKNTTAKLVNITIDNEQKQAYENSCLMDSLIGTQHQVPSFCYDKTMGKAGNCRMCMVEIEGQKRPQISCDTPVKEGMVVLTKSAKIKKIRQDILELELINHPLDCPICDQAGECDLQKFYMSSSGLYKSRLESTKVHAAKKVDLGRNIILDKERCVMCVKCVRFTNEVTKTKELAVFNRGNRAIIGIFPGQQMQTKYAMNVVDICPVGALTSKDFRFNRRVWFMRSFEGICNGCSKGCNIYVDHNKKKYKDDIIYRFRAKNNQDVNGAYICDYGRLGYKKELQNRLEESYFNNTPKNSNNIIKYISKAISNQSVTVLVSPNLSLEQLEAISLFCDEAKMHLSGYMPHYIDKDFEDDFLRKNDKSANQAGLTKYKINTSKKYFMSSLNYSKHLIIIDNDILDCDDSKAVSKEMRELITQKEIILFSYKNTQTKVKAKLPLPSFYEQDGKYINCDNITGQVKHTMKKNIMHPNMDEYIKKLKKRIK